ncbi:ABC transporter ATP-binding protein, partial [Streptococcus suis]
KKYCNQAVLLENGLVKALGNPDDVANQYSFDNAVAPTSVTEDKKEAQEESLCVDNLKVELVSANTISPREKVQFRISYDV